MENRNYGDWIPGGNGLFDDLSNGGSEGYFQEPYRVLELKQRVAQLSPTDEAPQIISSVSG